MNKKEQILAILAPLRAKVVDLDAFNALFDSSMDKLIELPSKFDSSFIEITEDILDKMNEDKVNGFIPNFLLDTMSEREQLEEVKAMASRALLQSDANDNVFYVKTLMKIGGEDLNPVFIEALPMLVSYDEDGGFGQEEIIDFLTENDDMNAAIAIIGCLNDITPAPRVRALALLYVKKMSIQEASGEMLRLLEDEEWEYNILIILELFKQWDKKEFVPNLSEISKKEYLLEDEVVYPAIMETIAFLSES